MATKTLADQKLNIKIKRTDRRVSIRGHDRGSRRRSRREELGVLADLS